MVAMPALDLIVSTAWVGALAVVLLAQAVYAWLGHRHWTRAARQAARLAEATRSTSRPQAASGSAPDLHVLPGGLNPSAADERPGHSAGLKEGA
jgi:hypothetical protein